MKNVRLLTYLWTKWWNVQSAGASIIWRSSKAICLESCGNHWNVATAIWILCRISHLVQPQEHQHWKILADRIHGCAMLIEPLIVNYLRCLADWNCCNHCNRLGRLGRPVHRIDVLLWSEQKFKISLRYIVVKHGSCHVILIKSKVSVYGRPKYSIFCVWRQMNNFDRILSFFLQGKFDIGREIDSFEFAA